MRQVGLAHYRAELSTVGKDRITVNLTDSDYGLSRLLRWQRPYPEEYRLGGPVAAGLGSLPGYTASWVRADLPPEPTQRDDTPSFAIAVILFCMVGIALRRL